MFIEKLNLISFKGFKNFSMECLPFTVLVGLNNSGKTSILQAIQLVNDIFVYAFGGYRGRIVEQPDFLNPQWSSDPSISINRLGFSDPDAIWLDKKTSVPCKISVTLSSGVEMLLEISSRNNYRLDIIVDGNTINTSLQEPKHKKIIEDIFTLFPTYVPPVGGLSPSEYFLTHPQLVEKLNKGQFSECWRTNLFWLYNDGNKEDFGQVVKLVQRYLPDATIFPPKLTRDGKAMVSVEFDQHGTTFDISTSGGGLRTILSIAVILYFSKSKCLLLDEPDAHLHSSLQQKVTQMLLDHAFENNVQVFATSHAPDFIAEAPIESLIWIDRTKNEGCICDGVGRFLSDLGAMTKADAIRAHGVDKILFVEGSLDRKNICEFVKKYCNENSITKNFFEDNKVIVAKLPNGKSDRTHLLAFQKLLCKTFKLKVKIACLVDNDYDLQINDLSCNNESNPLLLTLKRKEIENYLLDHDIIAKAVKELANDRQKQTGTSVQYPTIEEIQTALADILNDTEIRNTVKYQIVPKYRETLNNDLDGSSKEKRADEWFDKKWLKKDFQIRYCPGKKVLRQLRNWCQANYSLTLTDSKLIMALQEYPNDFSEVVEQIQKYFYSHMQ